MMLKHGFYKKPVIILFYWLVALTISSMAILMPVHADQNDTTQNPTWKKLLPQGCVFSSNFHQQKTITGLKNTLHSYGSLFFDCNHGLIWKSTEPFEESLIYTTSDQHFQQSSSDNITPIHGQSHFYLAKFLIAILRSDIKFIQDNFTITTPKTNHALFSPKNDIIKKALNNINIEQLPQNKAIIITIKKIKQDKTQLDITNTIIHQSGENQSACIKTAHSKQHCKVLYNPIQPTSFEGNN